MWGRACILVATGLLVGCGPLVDADRFRRDAVLAGIVGPDTIVEGATEPYLVVGAEGLASADPRLTISAPMGDSGAAAVLVTVNPDPTLAEGATATATLTAETADGPTTKTVTIAGLASLRLGGTVDAATLRPRYADIQTEAPVRFEGPAVRLESAGRIDIGHPLSVAAAGDVPGAGGSGHGAGARAGATAAAIEGGGCAGGGGGAGGRAAGAPGSAEAVGGPAVPQDADLLRIAAFAGHGGGAGGDAGQGADREVGGRGGAGGGAISLRGAALVLDGEIDARGGDGEGGTASGCGQRRAGGGGGGAGGAVRLAARRIDGVGRIELGGGAGSGVAQKAGGDGADGVWRVDGVLPEGLTAVGRSGPALSPRVGIGWQISEPRLGPVSPLVLAGPPGAAARVTVDDEAPVAYTFDDAGRIAVPAPASLGVFHLCATLDAERAANPEEAASCARIAVLP